jgi:hypothetical protein
MIILGVETFMDWNAEAFRNTNFAIDLIIRIPFIGTIESYYR